MLFTKNTNKEDSMNNDKSKAELSAAEKLGEALVLHPEWEVKPKVVEIADIVVEEPVIKPPVVETKSLSKEDENKHISMKFWSKLM